MINNFNYFAVVVAVIRNQKERFKFGQIGNSMKVLIDELCNVCVYNAHKNSIRLSNQRKQK